MTHVLSLLHLLAAAHLPVARKAALQGQVASPAHAPEACSIRHHRQMPAPCQLTRHPLHLGGRHTDPQTSANAVVGGQAIPDAVKLLLRYTCVLLTKQLQRPCTSVRYSRARSHTTGAYQAATASAFESMWTAFSA